MRKKRETMTAAELVAARERLGWSTERMSEEIGVLPAEAEALEAGSLPVSAETARIVRILVRLEERGAVLRASGLPECAEFAALDARIAAVMNEMEPLELQHALETLLAHEAGCPVCQARVEYLDAHAPPLPDDGFSPWARVLGWPDRMTDRLPGILRPPRGPAGEYRRMGIFFAAYLTAFAALVIGGGVALELLTGRTGEDSALRFAFYLPMLAAAYLVGGYVAGAAWDATRGIRHRLLGYVLRGGATAAAMYGAMMLMLPLMMEDDVPALVYLAGVGVLTVFGALAGAGKWLKDWKMDDLPPPPRPPFSP